MWYVISALVFQQGTTRDCLSVGKKMKDLTGAYLSQGSGIGQGMLCCPAARKVIHELAFGDKQLSISLMTNA